MNPQLLDSLHFTYISFLGFFSFSVLRSGIPLISSFINDNIFLMIRAGEMESALAVLFCSFVIEY